MILSYHRIFLKLDNLISSNSIPNRSIIYLDFNSIGANNSVYGKEIVTNTMIICIGKIKEGISSTCVVGEFNDASLLEKTYFSLAEKI